MRVLAIQTALAINSGGGRADYEVLSQLARRGHEIEAVMPYANRSVCASPPGVQIRWVYARGLKFPQSLGLMAFPGLLRAARRFRPHIIRDHSPYTYGLVSPWIGRLLDVPVVGTVYHLDKSILGARWVESNLLARYQCVLTISKFSQMELQQISPSVGTRTKAIYCGVASGFKRPESDGGAWRKTMGIPRGVPVFSTSGVLTPRKNHTFLLDVMQAWFREGRDGFLIITGEGELADQIKNLVRVYGLTDRVFFLGYVPENELCRVFETSTAFLFPSHIEGFGMAPAEAMACGTPPIVSDRGALPEVVRNGATGFVIPIDQGPEPWVRAMSHLCDDLTLRREIAAAAVADVRERFSWDRAGRETEAVYLQLISDHGGRE
ncbi:MAG: glycosyltransferase family 4 protein [Anaerolineales bacterium]|nr:glycosyltransferase family 4 protein [Anaerolineales bacterium]